MEAEAPGEDGQRGDPGRAGGEDPDHPQGGDQRPRGCQSEVTIRAAPVTVGTNLGVLYDKTGRFSESEQEYQAALRLAPDFPELYYNLGMLYLGRNRLKEAEKAFQRVLALNPRSADAHNNLALLYGRQGKLSAALSHLKEAMQLDPHNPLYRSNFADLARSQRR